MGDMNGYTNGFTNDLDKELPVIEDCKQAYETNAKAYKPGLSTKQVINVYNQWEDYDKVCFSVDSKIISPNA
jgi:hypothetical protein